MATELVRVEALSRFFPPDVNALDGIDLSIHAGEFVAITGSSGSGKSTLLSILGLLDRPTAGTYRFDGVDTTQMDDRALTRLRSLAIGFVFQAFHLVSYLSVLENVDLGLAYSGVASSQRNERATRALEQVGMIHRLAAYPPTLSGGEQQRTAIARAVVRRPRLLLCDEPTGNLDTGNTEALLDLLSTLQDDERALIVVTHDPDVAGRAGRVLAMRDGRIAEVE